MRRILSLLMLCALLGDSLPLPAAHAEDIQDSDFTYQWQLDNTLMITDYSGTSTDVVIPSEFDGTPVTAIGASAFDQLNNPGQPKLTSVTIPSSITMISSFAFAHNDLTAIEIPSVTSIGRGAFQYNQLQSVLFGKVAFLDAYAFADNQLESVTIPDSLGTVGMYAFQNNRLSSVSLPEGLEQIDYYAFAGNQLTTLQIPKSVVAINTGAFSNNWLGNVTIPPAVNLGDRNQYPVFNNNPNVAFYVPLAGGSSVQDHATIYRITVIPCKTNISYNGNGNTEGTPPTMTSFVCYNQTFAVPDQGTLSKDGYSFKGWNTKPDGSGTNYFGGNYPIYGDLNLVYPGTTLYANWELNSYQVTFDTRGGTSIPAQTVAYGERTAEPPVPARTDYAFVGWYTDPYYSHPWIFTNTITEDTTLYAKWKWNGTAAIASVELTANSDKVNGGDTLTVTGAVKDNNGSPVANAVVNLYSTVGKWKLTDVSDRFATTDENGKFIADWTAPWVTNPESVTITASVDGTTGIGDSQTLQLVPSEKSNAQLSGLSLGSIALSPEFSGDTLNYAAADVSNVVTSIDVTATTASDQSTLVLNYIPASTGINASVPAVSGSTVSIPLQTGMNLIAIAVTAEDGINGQVYTILVRRADTVTSGDYDYSLNDDGSGIAITKYKGTDLDVVIPKTIDGYVVKEIGMFAFANEGLTSVSIPDTVTNIGTYAFYGNQLSEITLPDGLTSVYGHALENNRLTSISFPSSVTLVDDYAFRNNLLENVTFADDGLQEIGFGAFSINQLSSIILPMTTTYVDSYAFKDNKLTQVILPGTLKLGDNVFGGTQNGVKLIIPADNDRELVNYATSNGFPFVPSDVHVEYDGNGDGYTEGETPVDSHHYNYYSSVTIQPSGTLKRTGYAFQGWNTEKDGSGLPYEAGRSYKFKLISGLVKLYAVWKPEPYSVSYETNGGTAIDATTANAGALLDEPIPAPSKAGHRFAGWYLDPDYKTEWNFERDTVTGDMILYAKWESEQLTIRLVTSSVALSGEEISVTGTVYDQGDTPQANIPVSLNSPNGGVWSLTESDKAKVTTDENGTFKVIWRAPLVVETATAELSASLDGLSAEPATVSIQVSPLPGRIPSSDADLAGLTISGGELTPKFQSGVTDYTADVGYATSSVTIVPEASDHAATVTVNGNTAESGQPEQVNLKVGSNPITIIVKAEDGTTTHTYHVAITRASAPVDTILVASISVTSVQPSVYVGGMLQMTASVSPDDAANKRVSWSLQSGTGRAVIDENGLLRAEHAGIVTVQATAQDGSGIVGSQAITIYERQPDGGYTPSTPTDPTPTDPTPTDPTPTDPTTEPPERPPVLNVIPGRPPFDVNDAGAIQTMLEALSAKFNDSRNANVPVFPDAEHHWAADGIRLFARLGIVEGYGDGTFKPDASITRGEFASMIVKLFPLTQGTAATPSFTDMGNSWARDAVLTLASNGIISGYEDGTFRADQNITRAEMIAILARMVNLAAVKQEKTVNLQDIDHSWAKVQIQLAANAGIINGRSGNVFDPNKSATRSEALVVLLRALSLSPEIEQLIEGMN